MEIIVGIDASEILSLYKKTLITLFAVIVPLFWRHIHH